ncbi:MAG TPA: replication initiation protein [Aquella sp.]|nr:replication initiation protein [Aquella sp.]
MKHFDIVMRQANNFVESAFAQEYSEQELKTMEFIISQTKKSDIELVNNNQIKTLELSATDFAKMINAHPNQIYRDADNLAKALMNKKYHFKYRGKDGKPAFETGTFLTSMRYDSGAICIKINPEVLPYFIEINSHFTEFNLRFLMAMGSSYGIKLYKLLKQYQTIGDRTLSIDDLRYQFGINDDKYKLYSDFKRNVIETAKRHINAHTDVQVEYKEIKLGRKVNALKFYIKAKMTQFKQARLEFINWIKDSKDEANKLLVITLEKEKKDPFQYKQIQKALEWYLTNIIYNYDANSCTPLQFFGNDTLFGNK